MPRVDANLKFLFLAAHDPYVEKVTGDAELTVLHTQYKRNLHL